MIDLFSNSSLLSTIEGQQEVAKRFDLPPETMDCLLRYVAYPKLEKRREETKELDAVWPAWKKEIDFSYLVLLKQTIQKREKKEDNDCFKTMFESQKQPCFSIH